MFGLPPSCRGTSSEVQAYSTPDSKRNWTCAERVLNKRPFAERLTSYEGDFNECPKRQRAEDGAVYRPAGHDSVVASMLHNGGSNTFLTRFSFCAVPASDFKQNPGTIPTILQEVASNVRDMFDNGVLFQGKLYRCALVGAKGDFEFQLEAGQFNRSYANVGTANDKRCCWECSAGGPGVSFTDMSDTPAWVQTIGVEPCWDVGVSPPFHIIPFSHAGPDPLMYRRDPFHMLKFGFGRDLAAGMIVHLTEMGYFDSEDGGESLAIPARLDRAWAVFRLWCIAEGKHPSLRRFTKENLKYADRTKLPMLNAKGADTTLVLTWLVFYITLIYDSPRQQADRGLLGAMLQTAQGFLDYVGVMHGHGLFLRRSCANVMLRAGYRFLRGYVYLAEESYSQGRAGGFNFRPKVHFFHHSLRDLELQLRDSDREWFMSHAVWNCEANEDFIGRLARISRRVSSRTCTLRTLQRYLVKVRRVMGRAKVNRG